MPQNVKISKFLFKAYVGVFNLNASNISCPLFVTWKRSKQTATSEVVQMVAGKADINQSLILPVNLYFDLDKKQFQEKKTVFSFTMKTSKGDKQAGVVHVDLAAQINDKIEKIEKMYALEKCPVKNSEVFISITGEFVGQKTDDTVSLASHFGQELNPDALLTQTFSLQDKRSTINQLNNPSQASKQNPKNPIKSVTVTLNEVDQSKKIKQLEQTVKSLKEQLINQKSIQQKLELQLNSYRQQNQQHEKQLESIRMKINKTYQNLCQQFQFDIQQL